MMSQVENNGNAPDLAMLVKDNHPYGGGGYISNPRRRHDPLPDLGSLVVTTSTRHAIRMSIRQMLSSTTKYLKVCSFIIEDEETSGALCALAGSLRIAVFVLTSLDLKSFTSSLGADETEQDGGPSEQRFERHLATIDKLVRAGAHVRAATDLHAKYVVRDGEEGLVTSANLTTPSMTMNSESGVVIGAGASLTALEHKFDFMFRNGMQFSPGGQGTLQASSTRPRLDARALLSLDRGTLVWTFGNSQRFLLDALIEVVNMSHRSLVLSTYSAVHLDRLMSLMGAIEAAVKRGVNAQVFTRAMDFRTDHLEGCRHLAKIGCSVFGDTYNHSKGIVADSAAGVIFSANLDGQHGLTSGYEVGVRLVGSDMRLKPLESLISWQLATAPYEFVKAPTHAEKKDFYAAMYAEKGITPAIPSFLVGHVSLHPEDKATEISFCRAIEQHPAFVERSSHSNDESRAIIRCGLESFKAVPAKEGGVRLQKAQQGGGKNRYFWNFESLSVHHHEVIQ